MTENEVLQKIKVIVAQKLETDPETLTDSSAAHNTPNWDSMAHMEIIAAIESEFKMQFSFEDMLKISNMGNIVAVVSSKVVEH